MNRTVTVTWRAFSGRPSEPTPEVTTTFQIDTDVKDLDLCEEIYIQTNLYQGPIWDLMQPLPEERSHTAISVIFERGDFVTIDGATYEVAHMGFKEVA